MEKERIFKFGLQILKALITVLLFCMAAVLLFAFIVKIASLSSDVIAPVNRVIKSVAVLLGCILFVKDDFGWLKGLLVGFLGVFTTKLLFSAIGGGLNFDLVFWIELLFGGVIGLISGVIAVNIHK